jgi:hypothetical protein
MKGSADARVTDVIGVTALAHSTCLAAAPDSLVLSSRDDCRVWLGKVTINCVLSTTIANGNSNYQ